MRGLKTVPGGFSFKERMKKTTASHSETTYNGYGTWFCRSSFVWWDCS